MPQNPSSFDQLKPENLFKPDDSSRYVFEMDTSTVNDEVNDCVYYYDTSCQLSDSDSRVVKRSRESKIACNTLCIVFREYFIIP